MEKNIRILIVDDEADFLETIVKRLNRRGFNVTGIDGALKALRLLDSESFDIVILDFKMPGMDGIDALKEMRRKKPNMEVIMLTGHASVESGIRGIQLGAFDYVMKPANIEDLIEKIQQAYKRKMIQEENGNN